MKAERKAEIASRLAYHPFLRLVFLDVRFRIAVVCGLLLFAFLAGFLGKIWRVTPTGFEPVVRISGVDRVQAWSLRRNALQQMAESDFDGAVYSWNAAIANHLGDPSLFRGALTNLLHLEDPPSAQITSGVRFGIWLMRLTETNQVDLELCAKVFNRFQLDDIQLAVLGTREDELNTSLRRPYMQALFRQGLIEEFDRHWTKLDDDAKADPVIRLYRAAYMAGWGPPGSILEGKSELVAALNDPEYEILAHRLNMVVNARLSEITEYKRSLEQMVARQQDRLTDHVGYWALLVQAGRRDEANALAIGHPYPPMTSVDVVRMSGVLIQLNLLEEAELFLQRYADEFAFTHSIWVVYGNLLVTMKDWDGLRALALKLRQMDSGTNLLMAYSYYLEGRSDHGKQRHAAAKQNFEKASEFPIENPALGLVTARSLLELGYAGPALSIGLGLEEHYPDHALYWHTMFGIAHQLREPDRMLASATKAYELAPDNLVYINNYAAALLIHRQHPAESIRLTVQLMAQAPNSVAARVNHSLSLLINHRTEEARSILRTINPDLLEPESATSYYLGMFEVLMNERRFSRALSIRSNIHDEHLFSRQVVWVERMCHQMRGQLQAKL